MKSLLVFLSLILSISASAGPSVPQWEPGDESLPAHEVNPQDRGLFESCVEGLNAAQGRLTARFDPELANYLRDPEISVDRDYRIIGARLSEVMRCEYNIIVSLDMGNGGSKPKSNSGNLFSIRYFTQSSLPESCRNLPAAFFPGDCGAVPDPG